MFLINYLLSIGYPGRGSSACLFLNSLLPRLLIRSNFLKFLLPSREQEVEIPRVITKLATDMITISENIDIVNNVSFFHYLEIYYICRKIMQFKNNTYSRLRKSSF